MAFLLYDRSFADKRIDWHLLTNVLHFKENDMIDTSIRMAVPIERQKEINGFDSCLEEEVYVA
jgi:hypothetical protein